MVSASSTACRRRRVPARRRARAHTRKAAPRPRAASSSSHSDSVDRGVRAARCSAVASNGLELAASSPWRRRPARRIGEDNVSRAVARGRGVDGLRVDGAGTLSDDYQTGGSTWKSGRCDPGLTARAWSTCAAHHKSSRRGPGYSASGIALELFVPGDDCSSG